MTYKAIKNYLEHYLSKNERNTLRMDNGVQINDLRKFVSSHIYLIELIPVKKRLDNAQSRASKGNLKMVVDYLESL